MALPFLDGPTIPAGESLSDAVDCQGFWILRIFMPEDWTRAPLTFLVSADGEEFHDLYHTQDTSGAFVGFEVVVPEVEPGVSVTFPANTGGPVNWIKLRSGTRNLPVTQAAERTFRVLLDDTRSLSGGAGGSAGAAGPTGPAGSPGTPGSAGSAGATGPTGSSGSTSFKGVTNASEPPAGDIGEFLAASNAPGISLTTLVTANVTTLILPPGDWLVGGVVIFVPAGTGPNSLIAGLSTVAQTMPTDNQVIAGNGAAAQIWSSALTSGKPQTVPTGAFRVNSATNTNVYLVAQSSFGGGSVVATGRVTARRTR